VALNQQVRQALISHCEQGGTLRGIERATRVSQSILSRFLKGGGLSVGTLEALMAYFAFAPAIDPKTGLSYSAHASVNTPPGGTGI
jgi:hypothetical protein